MKVKLMNEDFKNNYFKNLMLSRGVADIEWYMRPTEAGLGDPALLDNIDKGVALLKSIIDKKGKILLIVDSDCDGFTSSAIIYNYIKDICNDISITYLLHSGKQHGLEDHIDNIMDMDQRYDLIILPDSSSNDFEYHERLKSIGTKCLVLDHHEAEPPYSDNAIIINNQLSAYTNKALTGAGITWQFCRFYDRTYGYSYADQYIDLAALGIIGDMGSILDYENRYIIDTGINNLENFFFKCLVDKQSFSLKGELTPIGIAFYIVPLINAMVRFGSEEEKDRMFRAFIDGMVKVPTHKRGAKPGAFERLGVESAREASNVRSRQNSAKEKIVASIEEKIFKNDLLANKILFIRLDEDDVFPAELNGLVAMELSKKHKHPTIIARLNEDGFNRGSIRGLENCELEDFKAFLTESGYFEYVQGHANAAGASIKDNQLDAFLNYSNEKLKDVDLGEGAYDVNFVRSAFDKDLTDLIFDLGCHEDIWGSSNDAPRVYVHDINITKNDIQVVGKNQDTVKFEKNGITYIKFFAKDFLMELRQYDEIKVNVICKPSINDWCGNSQPQMMVDGYEVLDGYMSF